MIPVDGLDLVGGSVDLLSRPAWVLATGGNIIKQKMGVKNADGIGEVFMSNTFGHYILVRQLEDMLSKESRVIWVSSTTAEAHLFNYDDLQGLKRYFPLFWY